MEKASAMPGNSVAKIFDEREPAFAF